MATIQGTSHLGIAGGWGRVSTLNNENKTAEETNLPSSSDDYLAIVCTLNKLRLTGQKSTL